MDGGLFPRFLQSMLERICRWLTKPQRAHLRWFLFALLASSRKAKLSHVARTAPRGGYRTSCGCFLRSDWDAPQLLSDQAMRTLRWMKPKAKEVIYLIIDDTRIEKRGRTMEAVTKIYDHKTLRFVRGHIVVTAALMFRGVVMLGARVSSRPCRSRPPSVDSPRSMYLAAAANSVCRCASSL